MNQGAVIAKKSNKPLTMWSRFQIRQSQALNEYAINTRVGSAAPIKPLDRVASAMNVQQSNIQPRVPAVVLLS